MILLEKSSQPIVSPYRKVMSNENRSERRKAQLEISKIAPALLEVETTFINLLFLDPHSASYRFYYERCHMIWLMLIEKLKKQVKPRHIQMNEAYFQECFMPIERPWLSIDKNNIPLNPDG